MVLVDNTRDDPIPSSMCAKAHTSDSDVHGSYPNPKIFRGNSYACPTYSDTDATYTDTCSTNGDTDATYTDSCATDSNTNTTYADPCPSDSYTDSCATNTHTCTDKYISAHEYTDTDKNITAYKYIYTLD